MRREVKRCIADVESTETVVVESYVNGIICSCRTTLSSDADFAGNGSASTASIAEHVVVVGPNTWAPIGRICKSPNAVSHSSARFRLVLRSEGIPAHRLWQHRSATLQSRSGAEGARRWAQRADEECVRGQLSGDQGHVEETIYGVAPRPTAYRRISVIQRRGRCCLTRVR